MMAKQAVTGREAGETASSRTSRSIAGRLRPLAFWRDRRGAAALEFAFLAPVLICMYFMSMEVSQAIETSKKVSRIGSMVADLLTQQSALGVLDVQAILKIGGALIQPYNRSAPKITVTAIQVSTDGAKAVVQWSQQMDSTGFSAPVTKGITVTVPDKLKVANTFLIKVESNLTYYPVLTWPGENKKSLGLAAAFDELNMDDIYYLRPRMSDSIGCSTC